MVVSPASEKRGERKDVSLSLSLSLSLEYRRGCSLSLSSKQGKERHDVNGDESVSRSIEIVCVRAREERKRERERRFFWCVFLCCAVFWSTRNGKKSACRMRNYIISFSRAKPFDDGDR